MGRTILCNTCKSTFDEDILKRKNSENECPVCGASLLGEGDSSHESPSFGEDIINPDLYFYEIDDNKQEDNLRDV